MVFKALLCVFNVCYRCEVLSEEVAGERVYEVAVIQVRVVRFMF